MKKYLFPLLLIIILPCCREKKPIPEIVFTKDSFERIFQLEPEIVEFNKALHPMAFEILRDSIIMVRNWDASPGSFFEFYSVDSFNLLGVYGAAGRGPHEFIGPMGSYYTNKENGFVISDVSLKRASFYNLDSVLTLGNSYTPKRFEIPDFIYGFVFIDSSTVVAYNSFYLNNFKFSNKGARPLYIFETTRKNDFEKEIEKHNYYTLNVSRGHIAISPDKRNMLVFYDFVDRIDIFNNDLKLIKRLRGPGSRLPEFKIIDDESNYVWHKGPIVNAYWRLFFNDQHIFALYQGYAETEVPVEPSTEVHKFGWNGELLHRYILTREPGMKFITISVDSKENYMYCTLSRTGKQPLLIRFRLPN